MRFAFPIAVTTLLLLSLPAIGILLADLLGYGPDLNTRLESTAGVSHKLALSLPAAFVLLAVPVALAILHLLRLRRRPLVVSSTLLWRASMEDHHANALFRWLQRNVSLLLQLLAALLLVYGILGPRLHSLGGSGRHYIIVVDNSASMAATDVPPTRLEWAKAEALRRIEAAGDDDVGMVIAFNRTAEIRLSYTSDREALRAAVRGISQSAAQTRLDEALRLAAGLTGPTGFADPSEGNAAEVHLYSDGGFPPVTDHSQAGFGLVYHSPPVREKSDNVAIVRLDATRDDSGGLGVAVTVRNYRDADVNCTARLDVLDGGRPVRTYAREVRVNATGTTEVEFSLAEPEMPLRIALEGVTDSLPLDDGVWVVPAVARKAQVAVVGPANAALEAFLASPATLKIADVTRLSPADLTDPKAYLDPARDGRYDLVIFDRCAPTSASELPRANTLFIGSRPPGVGAEATPVKNPRVVGWAGTHSITRGLRDLYGVPIAEAARLTGLPPRTERLIESDGNLLLLAGVPRPPFTDLVLAFPILDENGKWNTLWPLEPSFVLFLRNVTRAYGNVRDGFGSETTRPGDAIVLRGVVGKPIKVTLPNGRTESIDPGDRADVSFADTSELGAYSVTGGMIRSGFAVNLLDSDESDLAPRPLVSIGGETSKAEVVQRPSRPLWKLAALAALLVVLAEWWVYAARVR